jgi:hypothetical protein
MKSQFKVFYCITRLALGRELQGFPCEFDGRNNLIDLYLFGWFAAARQGAQWTPTTN